MFERLQKFGTSNMLQIIDVLTLMLQMIGLRVYF